MSNIVPINAITGSSNLAGYGYDPSTQTLAVQFKSGAVHHYVNVPRDVAEGFHAAESRGKFFAANVRDQFESRRTDTDDA